MKNLKKVLALVIALTMVLSTVAFASYADVDYEADYAGAVELLSALNVLKGDENGNFNPDNTITRAEFAAVVCRCLGLESSASSAAGATAFTDVAADHWAAGYVNLATQYGIINGRGNGIFDPNGNVTFAEAVKMLVVAIGYEPMAATKGGYPTGYLTVANSTKMTAGVSAAGANAAALRSTVAQLAANALEIPKMDQVGFGSDTSFEVFDDYDNYASLLTAMDVFKLTGVITNIDKVKEEVTVKYTQGSDDYEFGYKKNGDEIAFPATITFDLNGSNAVDFVQKNADIYVQKVAKGEYDILFVVPSEVGETLTIKAEDLNTSAATFSVTAATTLEYKESKNATKYTKFDVAARPLVYINGVEITNLYVAPVAPATAYTAGTNFALVSNLSAYVADDAVIEFVENTDDDVFDIINITIYEHAIVEEVEVDKERINFVGGSAVRFDSEDKDQVVDLADVNGNEIALEDIKAGDVLAMVVNSVQNTPSKFNAVDARNFAAATSRNQITIYNLGANTVTGKITEADDGVIANANDNYVYIDGTEYQLATDFVDGNYSHVVASGAAKLGAEGTFYLAINGSIIGFDGEAGSNGNYGYVLQAEYNNNDKFNSGWQVKMLTADGEIDTYDLYKTLELKVGLNIYTGITTSAVDNNNTNDGGVAKVTAAETFFGSYTGTTAFNAAPANNVVEYKLATDGTIKSIATVGATAVGTSAVEFNASTNKLGSKLLADDVVIFNLANITTADDAKVADISALVDDGTYNGYVFDNDDKEGYKVFVMTVGNAAFDASAKYNVVTSVRKTTYNSDDSAVIVKYYTEGVAEELTAIFTTDSQNKIATNRYDTLTKGDIFVANTNAEGVVSDYVVLATVSGSGFTPVAGALAAAYGNEVKTPATAFTSPVVGEGNIDDGAAYFISYFKEVKNGVVYFEDAVSGNDYAFRIGAGAGAYNFTAALGGDVVEAGEWQGTNVDKANYVDANNNKTYDAGETVYGAKVLVKLYDGEVIDIYAINAMETQTVFN